MNIKEYQSFVESGASSSYDKKLSILGLVGEVGELADVVKKESIYPDMSKFTEKYGMPVEDKIKDEAGDVLWQFTLVLCKYNLSFEEVLDYNVNKLLNRHGGVKNRNDGGTGR